MVAHGQFLERQVVVPCGRVVLEALWHRGTREPPLLIVPPAPGEGGMDHVVASELAFAAASRGFPTLRFNHRGVGASQRARGAHEHGGRDGRDEDVSCAAALLCENAQVARIALVAIGSGALCALRFAARASVGLRALALVDPPEPGEAVLLDALRRGGLQIHTLRGTDGAYLKGLALLGRRVGEWLEGL